TARPCGLSAVYGPGRANRHGGAPGTAGARALETAAPRPAYGAARAGPGGAEPGYGPERTDRPGRPEPVGRGRATGQPGHQPVPGAAGQAGDRKSTRLNSSHVKIS